MHRSDIISIVVTFLVGMVVGVYLYLFGFAQQFDVLEEISDSGGEELVINGEAYGGCARGGGCGTFQVAGDGAFTSFPPVAVGDERLRRTGRVDEVLWDELSLILTPLRLRELATEAPSGDCASFYDGIDYRFYIDRGDERFLIDTCTTLLRTDERVLDLLQQLTARALLLSQ